MLDAVRDEIEGVARRELRRYDLLHDESLLLVDRDATNIRWRFFYQRTTSTGSRVVQLDCRLHPNSRQMWIGEVWVPPLLRRRGWGRRLVKAAEAVARAMSSETVSVFPLVGAQAFWKRLGYRPHPRTARVLVKKVRRAQLAGSARA